MNRFESARTRLCWLCGLLVLAGCARIGHQAKLPLKQAGLGTDGVVLEVYSIRVPAAQQQALCLLWNEIDEQALPLAQRQRLTSAGFRVGVIDGRLPRTLEQMMQLADSAPSAGPDTTEVPLETEDATVRRRILQVRSGRQGDIIVSGLYPSLPVLHRGDDGQLTGTSYPDAQGFLAVKAFPQGDGRVRVQVRPEVRYGDYSQQWVPTDGLIRIETGRDVLSLDGLQFAAELAPGQIVVLSRQAANDGSLGQYFFSAATDGVTEQKLLLLRVAQSQYDDLFGGDDLGY